MGPSALRYAGLTQALTNLGHKVEDLGDIRIPNPELTDGENRTQAVADVCEIKEMGQAPETGHGGQEDHGGGPGGERGGGVGHGRRVRGRGRAGRGWEGTGGPSSRPVPPWSVDGGAGRRPGRPAAA